jgi:hypothetical protein
MTPSVTVTARQAPSTIAATPIATPSGAGRRGAGALATPRQPARAWMRPGRRIRPGQNATVPRPRRARENPSPPRRPGPPRYPFRTRHTTKFSSAKGFQLRACSRTETSMSLPTSVLSTSFSSCSRTSSDSRSRICC